MADRRIIEAQEYYKLMWWAVKGFQLILHGEPPKETAMKYLDGIGTLVNELEETAHSGLVEWWKKIKSKLS